jgi:hypothetical protein
MVYRMEDLMRQVERTVPKRLVQQVVRGGDRPDQGVLDRKAAGVGTTFADCFDHILYISAGQGCEIGPAPTGGGLAERPVRSLDSYAHETLQHGK